LGPTFDANIWVSTHSIGFLWFIYVTIVIGLLFNALARWWFVVWVVVNVLDEWNNGDLNL